MRCEIYLPPPKVAPHSADESWRVVEDLRISCALKLRRASRPQNLNSPLVCAKCLLIGHHHLLEEAAHAKEVVHDSRCGECAPEGASRLFFGFF
ncbi:hypothetical protein EBU02_12895 [bacterium]|nr:hypothetical protein [bacterium]